MTEILFYHIERGSPSDVLPGLLERTLSRGWTAVVRCRDEGELRALDDHLWTYHDESFLPHGAGAADERVPVWLTTGDELPEGRDVLFALSAETFRPEGLNGLTRAVLMFGAGDAPAARAAWKAVQGAGAEATYWKQDEHGRWVKAG